MTNDNENSNRDRFKALAALFKQELVLATTDLATLALTAERKIREQSAQVSTIPWDKLKRVIALGLEQEWERWISVPEQYRTWAKARGREIIKKHVEGFNFAYIRKDYPTLTNTEFQLVEIATAIVWNELEGDEEFGRPMFVEEILDASN